MTSIRTIWRYVKWPLLGFLVVLVLFILAAFIGSVWATKPVKRDCAKDREIFVTTGGVHLDIVIPVEFIPDHLKHSSYFNDSITQVAFGWGERDFYLATPTWEDLTLGGASQALLVPSESLMHVTRYLKQRRSWKSIPLCEEEMEALLNYIDQSFRKTSLEDWTEVPSTGYSRHDFFYEANGNYHAINTCNTWINKALKEANVKTGRWSPMPQGIVWHLED